MWPSLERHSLRRLLPLAPAASPGCLYRHEAPNLHPKAVPKFRQTGRAADDPSCAYRQVLP